MPNSQTFYLGDFGVFHCLTQFSFLWFCLHFRSFSFMKIMRIFSILFSSLFHTFCKSCVCNLRTKSYSSWWCFTLSCAFLQHEQYTTFFLASQKKKKRNKKKKIPESRIWNREQSTVSHIQRGCDYRMLKSVFIRVS